MARYTIVKAFSFAASHQLQRLPAGHKCGRLHGHNYVVELELSSEKLNGAEMVRDYGELEEFKMHLDSLVDHRHLNDFLPQPTAEALAEWFFMYAIERWPELVAVRVRETDKTCAEYRA